MASGARARQSGLSCQAAMRRMSAEAPAAAATSSGRRSPRGRWRAAVRASIDLPAYLLWFAVTVWIAGFDLLYACQDVEFDRRERLHAVPVRFGVPTALRWARYCHLLTVLALAGAGWVTGLGWPYWVGWLAVVGLFAYEHSLVSPSDLSRLDMAFFNVNGYIAVILLAATSLSIFLERVLG